MEALSTFIKLYVLSIIAFLIPSANSIDNGIEKTVSYSQSKIIDIDETNPILPSSHIEPAISSDDLAVNNVENNLEYIIENSTEENFEYSLEGNLEDLETEINYFQFSILDETETKIDIAQIKPDFWTTLHSIESKQGRLMYRPSNKNKNCATTIAPCGHHQLSLLALKDISCSSKQCMKDRENFDKSLAMSKQLQAINNKRIKKSGYINLPDYQKYLIHQQGAIGLKIILAASKGNKELSKNIKKNMAGNSPYSYKSLKRFGSKLAAKKFLQHWEKKWINEKKLVGSLNKPTKKFKAVIKPISKLNLPQFNDYELQIALNLKL